MTIHRAIIRRPERKGKGPERDSIQSPRPGDTNGSISKFFRMPWSHPSDCGYTTGRIETFLGQGAIQVKRERVFFGNDAKGNDCSQKAFDRHVDCGLCDWHASEFADRSPSSVGPGAQAKSRNDVRTQPVSPEGGLQTRSPITSCLIIRAGRRLNHLRG